MPNVSKLTPGGIGRAAIESFAMFGGARPQLVRLGIPPVDEVLGGLSPGTSIVVGMDQGVGKSRTLLSASRASQDRWGIISLEDPADVLGSRILAMESGVNSLAMRRGVLSPDQRRRVREAQERLEADDGFRIACCVGGDIEDVGAAVDWLADEGCLGIWLDYVQKIRGIRDDRNNEVATAMTLYHRRCAARGVVAGLASQITGQLRGERPYASQLRETRDLANEARVIILGWRDEARRADGAVNFVLDKSTYGGGGLRWSCKTAASGMLEYEAGSEGSEF